MPNTHLADFHGYPIQVIEHNDQPWLSAEQVGTALGLKHPRQGISKLYNRHAEEFTSEMTCVVDVATGSRGNQKTRIFSPRGAWMLGMWAQTERAKLFRQWVLDVLEKQQELQCLEIPAYLRKQHAAVKRALLAARPDYAKLIRYTELGLTPTEISKLLSITVNAVRTRQIKLESLGLLRRNVNPALAAAGRKGHQAMLEARHG